MRTVTYVFRGKDFTAKITSYDNALAIKEKTGLNFTREYVEVKSERPSGKYVGKTIAKYVSAYH